MDRVVAAPTDAPARSAGRTGWRKSSCRNDKGQPRAQPAHAGVRRPRGTGRSCAACPRSRPRRSARSRRPCRAWRTTRGARPAHSIAWRWWCAGFIRKSSGTSKASATSKALSVSRWSGLTSPTTGVMMNCDAGGVGGQLADHLDPARAPGRFPPGLRAGPCGPRRHRCRRACRRERRSARSGWTGGWCARSAAPWGARASPSAPAPRHGPAAGRRSGARPRPRAPTAAAQRNRARRASGASASRAHRRQVRVHADHGHGARIEIRQLGSAAVSAGAGLMGMERWAGMKKPPRAQGWRRPVRGAAAAYSAAAGLLRWASFSLMRADLPLRSRR